jgi:hypothetical protein
VLSLLPLLVALGPGLAAQSPSPEDLLRQIEELRAEVARLREERVASAQVQELERRIDLLAAEIEKQRTGGAVEADTTAGVYGFAPAASKVYRTAKGVSIGGYGEAVYENYARENQSGSASGRTDQFDFVRQILYVGYKFSDRILFNSELEFEHASTGKGGEASVEFGYLDLKLSDRVGVRAGMLLVPMGFLNELHEPPIFHGARRPEVEQAILPSTWRENGAGVFGSTGPFEWRAYAVASLQSGGFTAAGIRGGRQSGARSKAEDLAFTARADFTGVGGLLLGAALFTGGTGQDAIQDGLAIGGRLTLVDVHAQYERRGLQLRALYVRGSLDDVALINLKNGLTGSRSVGEAQYGFYVQAAYDVLARRAGRWSLTPFVRYERLDTQDDVPAGFVADPANDRTAWTAGAGVKPLPNVVFKADYQWFRNAAQTGVGQLNLALGYLF